MGREAQQQVKKTVPVLADSEVTAYVARLGQDASRPAPGGRRIPTASRSRTIATSTRSRCRAARSGFIAASCTRPPTNRRSPACWPTRSRTSRSGTPPIRSPSSWSPMDFSVCSAPCSATIPAARAPRKSARESSPAATCSSSAATTSATPIASALEILRRAGWDPRGMADFMDVLRREQGRDPGAVEVFLSTHPAPAERAVALRHLAAQHPGGRRDSAAFRAVKTRVLRLPPAPKSSR